MQKITHREEEVLNILWNSSEPLAAGDILQASGHLSMRTIQQSLKSLLSKGLIRVERVGMKGKALARYFVPVVSQAEFIQSAFSRKNSFLLVQNFVESSSDPDELEQLQKLIEKKKKK